LSKIIVKLFLIYSSYNKYNLSLKRATENGYILVRSTQQQLINILTYEIDYLFTRQHNTKSSKDLLLDNIYNN